MLQKETGTILVFCDRRGRVDKVCEFLKENDIKSLPFYDDKKRMTYQQRVTTLSLLKEGRLQVMVCTDFASWGFDTHNIDHVVQFDFAKTAG